MKTNNVSIKAIPHGQPVGPLHWDMSINGGPVQGSGSYPVITVTKGDDAVLTFTIDHPGSIAFAQDNPNPHPGEPSGPIYIQAGTAKPTAGVDSQFTVQGAGTQTLTVTDSNMTAGKYTYVLNFNHGVPQLDPIVQNGGGGGGLGRDFLGATATQLVVALLVVLVAAVLVRQFFGKPAAPSNETKGP